MDEVFGHLALLMPLGSRCSPLPLLAGRLRFGRRTLALLPGGLHRAFQLSEAFPCLFHTGFYLR